MGDPVLSAANCAIADFLKRFSSEERLLIVQALLMQEVCERPVGERAALLERIRGEMPMILRATEEGMRAAIAENVRRGLA